MHDRLYPVGHPDGIPFWMVVMTGAASPAVILGSIVACGGADFGASGVFPATLELEI